MTRKKLLNLICDVHPCADFNLFFNNWLDEYDKQIRTEVINEYYNKINEKLKTDTNLKDTIKDIHDNIAREMYCKGIDDFAEKLKDYFIIPRDAKVNCMDIKEFAKKLKEGVKNE